MKIISKLKALESPGRNPESYKGLKSIVIPGRSKTIADLIARSSNGASSNYFRKVEYDGTHVDIENPSIVDDPDFTYCDMQGAESEYNDRLAKLSELKDTMSATTTINDDDAVSHINNE